MRVAIDPIERLSLALGASAVALSFAFATPRFAASLAFGAALEAINLHGLMRSAHVLFSSHLEGQGTRYAGFGARFGILAVGIYAAIAYGADPVGLLVGLSVAVPAAIVTAWRNRPPVLEHDLVPAPPPDDESWDHWSIWRAGNTSWSGALEEEDTAVAAEPADERDAHTRKELDQA